MSSTACRGDAPCGAECMYKPRDAELQAFQGRKIPSKGKDKLFIPLPPSQHTRPIHPAHYFRLLVQTPQILTHRARERPPSRPADARPRPVSRLHHATSHISSRCHDNNPVPHLLKFHPRMASRIARHAGAARTSHTNVGVSFRYLCHYGRMLPRFTSPPISPTDQLPRVLLLGHYHRKPRPFPFSSSS